MEGGPNAVMAVVRICLAKESVGNHIYLWLQISSHLYQASNRPADLSRCVRIRHRYFCHWQSAASPQGRIDRRQKGGRVHTSLDVDGYRNQKWPSNYQPRSTITNEEAVSWCVADYS